MVDQDTDRWVHEVLAPELRAELQRCKSSEQFTDLCARLLVKLHQKGRTEAEIRDALTLLPFHPGVKRGISQLKLDRANVNTDLFLLSNSNTVYISTILSVSRAVQFSSSTLLLTGVARTAPQAFRA